MPERSSFAATGVVRSEIIYLDDEGRLVDRQHATKAEIVEYDKDGEQVRRTYGYLKKETSHGEEQ